MGNESQTKRKPYADTTAEVCWVSKGKLVWGTGCLLQKSALLHGQ